MYLVYFIKKSYCKYNTYSILFKKNGNFYYRIFVFLPKLNDQYFLSCKKVIDWSKSTIFELLNPLNRTNLLGSFYQTTYQLKNHTVSLSITNKVKFVAKINLCHLHASGTSASLHRHTKFLFVRSFQPKFPS